MLCKTSQKLFSKNPYKAIKDIYILVKHIYILFIEKSDLDSYMSDSVKDDKYNLPLISNQGLDDEAPTTISFPAESLDFNDLFF